MRILLLSLLLLDGCVSGVTGSTYWDGRFWYSNVKSASDIAGGPRQDLLIAVDRNGAIVENTVASGPGTLQTVVGGLNALITSGGNVAGDAVIRPARNNTSATINGGTGVANASGSASSSASPSASASGAGGQGGNATAAPP